MLNNIIVCMKVVPKPDEIKFDMARKVVDRKEATNIINPPDKNALELAIRLKENYGGNVIVISMGPPFFSDFLNLALMMGADKAILISDKALAGSDTLPTTLTLAKAIEKIGNYSIVLCGEESIDGSTGQVPPGIAEWLNIPHITKIYSIELKNVEEALVKRKIKGGYELLSIKIPFVASVELGCNNPRFPNFKKKKIISYENQIITWNIKDLSLKPEEVGFRGSATAVIGVEEARPPERIRKFIRGDAKEIAEKLLGILKKFT